MLTLQRTKKLNTIHLYLADGERIVVEVDGPCKVRIGAPKSVRIVRAELKERNVA